MTPKFAPVHGTLCRSKPREKHLNTIYDLDGSFIVLKKVYEYQNLKNGFHKIYI